MLQPSLRSFLIRETCSWEQLFFRKYRSCNFKNQAWNIYICILLQYFYFDNLTTKLFLPIIDYLWQILRHICLHIKLYQIPLENSLFIHVLDVGRCIHPLATTDRPLCQQTGFYLLLRGLEIKRNINKLKTCKYTNKWTAERKYGMTKGAFAVLSWSPRSWLIYTIRSVSANRRSPIASI